MNEQTKKLELPFYAKLALVLLAICLILLLMIVGQFIIVPLFFSFLIALLLLPLTKWLERRKFPKTIAALLSILSFITIVISQVFFFANQFANFSKDIPELGKRIGLWINELQSWISHRFGMDYSHQLEYLNKASSSILGFVSDFAQNFIVSFGSFLVWTVFVFIFTFFVLTHRMQLLSFIKSIFSPKYRAHVHEVALQTQVLAYGYILGLLIEMLVVGVLNCSVLMILGVKYALLLGVLAAVLNIIPFIGIYIATAIAVIITLSNSTLVNALWVGMALISIHLFDANILLPQIVGSRVKMNSFTTIIAVLIGSKLWGISGTFLFIPLAAMLKIIFERVEELRPYALLMGDESTHTINNKKVKIKFRVHDEK